MTDPVFLTVDQAAKRGQVCKNTMYAYIDTAGAAVWFRIGRAWRIRTSDFDAWLPVVVKNGGTTKSRRSPIDTNAQTEIVDLVTRSD